jgi:hypothetical protein
MSDNEQVGKELVQLILDGEAQASDIQAASRVLQLKLASDLVATQQKLTGWVESLSSFNDRLMGRFTDQFNVEIESMTLEQCTDLIQFVTGRQIAILEVQRKIAQGKNLLESTPTMTEEERTYMQMIKTFSPKEKKVFYSLLQERITEISKNGEPEKGDELS